MVGIALMHVGEAHAMHGEAPSCEKALGAALAQFDRSSDADPAAEFFTPDDHGRLAGSSYLFLGRPERAVGTLAPLRRDGKKASAIVLGNLSIAHIRTRQLDAALSCLHEAINVVEATRGGGGMNLVFTAGRELARWRDEPAVRQVNDRLLALMTAA
ncbi:hypothetical protein [Spirillospora sp. NPDC047279]|uniref:hypothetical protein n=1 Tax=Spirillospora sp. NPDC047279 TaxID=3155478 RepID=UPI0033F0C62E